MSASVVRRVRLAADRRTPAAARAVVRAALLEAGLDELLDEALLLTTELATNGVVHAGTEIELDVLIDPDGLTVTVTDFSSSVPGQRQQWATGALASLRAHESAAQAASDPPPEPAGPAESGRGLLLVDHFAASWGITHQATGKGVWFRLDRQTGSATAEAGQPATAPTAPTAAALASLGATLPTGGLDDEAELAAGRHPAARRLLYRLCAILNARGGAVRLDRADGRGLVEIADCGPRTDRSPPGGEIRLPLALSRPWRGELRVTTAGAPDPYALALAGLTADRLGLLLENDRLRRTDLRRQAWLTFLSEASELLAQSLDVELTMALIPRLIVPRLGVWCAVYAVDDWAQPRLASSAHQDEAALPELLRHLTIPTDPEPAVDSPAGRLREAVRAGGTVALPAPVDGFAVPLTARGQRIGILAVGRHADHRQDPEELALVEDVGRRAALALDNARIHAERRRVAQTLQQSLLPPALPSVPGLAFGAEYVPTVGDAMVGGDFYDVVPMRDGRWLVVVGDVSGKGVQAATVTGLVRDVIRVLIRDGKPLPEILYRINETLVERGAGRYCTLAMAAVTPPVRGPAEVELHLAGHDRAVLVGADGTAEFVGSPGTALGLLARVATPSMIMPLPPGGTLIFYTDGVTDRRSGSELFGMQRLLAAAGPLAGYAADVVAARLRATALGFSPEPPRDDIAILALRNDLTP